MVRNINILSELGIKLETLNAAVTYSTTTPQREVIIINVKIK